MRLALLAFGLSLFVGSALAQPTLTPQHSPVLRPRTTQLVPPATQPAPLIAAPSTTGGGCPGTNDAPGRTGGTGALTNVTGHPGALGIAPTGDGNGQNVPPHGQNGLQAMSGDGKGENPHENGPPPHGQNAVSPDAPAGQTVGGGHGSVASAHIIVRGGTPVVNPVAESGEHENHPSGGQPGPGTQVQCAAAPAVNGIVSPR